MMTDLKRVDFGLVLLPGNQELDGLSIEDYPYCGGYSEYSKELQNLFQDIMSEWFARDDTEKGKEIQLELPEALRAHGNFPEIVFELGMLLCTGAVGGGLFNLLNAWVKKANGRKIRVRLPSGLEVEATQLTQSDFKKLLSEIQNRYGEALEVEHFDSIKEHGVIEKMLDEAVIPARLISRAEAEREKRRLAEKYWKNSAGGRKDI